MESLQTATEPHANAVAYGWWSCTRGDRIWRFDCICVFVICDLTALKPDLKRVNDKKT